VEATMVDYLGSTINVVASSLGLVTVVIFVLAGAGLWIWPAVIVAYAIGAAGSYLVLRRSGKIAPPTSTTKPRRAAS
jgi:hypothetical protein